MFIQHPDVRIRDAFEAVAKRLEALEAHAAYQDHAEAAPGSSVAVEAQAPPALFVVPADPAPVQPTPTNA